ncbi:methyltransferase, TIGR00027 family protein [Mycobacterium ulcerans str. Harvey]|uniref:S-adenosyl-L-methionine-dependent methyltransferase n=1 Tax=Mycobacterium ulcerans str. Harvey TaxID=1299332 RepID=A0ABN0R6M2_MYCUL|nr:methyltransferase, TIGR00027 family protein [Mycobacterium ulcerans str. Harvey]
MVRTDRDRWDLATSVGATATMVAAQRALAADPQYALIDDPYAAPLVRAVDIDVYTRLVNGQIPVDVESGFDPARMPEAMACRTRFYDQFFVDATRSGISQVVILASGLDARAYRLGWPAGTVVYEVDMPQVIEFKTLTLADLGPSRPPNAAPLRSTCVTIGRPCCRPPDSTRTCPRHGAPKACSSTYPMTPKARCSTTSPRSVLRAAGWPSSLSPTRRCSTTSGGVRTMPG